MSFNFSILMLWYLGVLLILEELPLIGLAVSRDPQ